MTTKKCASCGAVKPVSEFGDNRRTADGLAVVCFVCARKTYNRWYAAHRAEKLAAVRRSRTRYRVTKAPQEQQS